MLLMQSILSISQDRWTFAIARCSNISQDYVASESLFGKQDSANNLDKSELRHCINVAINYIKEHYPAILQYKELQSFYALSVCIPTKDWL